MQASGRAMSDALARRGPDDEGSWQDPDLPLFLGHRRLSIIDLSPGGHQPMASDSERYIAVFNGEIYNFMQLSHTLEAEGVPMNVRSDTAVMLAAIEHWGLNQALQKLEGMFALALWDRKEKLLHLVRDRMGKKPLYMGWAGKNFVFGSELKALRAHPDFVPQINRQALTLYMRYGCVPAPFSIYDNVWQLLPGCRASIDVKTLFPGADLAALAAPYWHMPRIVEEARQQQSPANDAQAIEDFENILKAAVKDRMVSDVPLGAFLSGGIDSSAVVALMQRQANEPVKTFSIGFEQDGFDESAYAAKIAAHLGTDHHELICTPQDALDIIPQLPEIYDEPFADVSQIPTFMVSRFARQHVTVALSGDGGDEMLGGYLRHYVAPALWRRVGWLPRGIRGMMGGGLTALSAERWDSLVPQHPQFGERIYKVAELLRQDSAENVYRQLVSQWPDPAALVCGGAEAQVPLVDESWQPKGLGFAERMMYGDALSYLPNDILTKLDRASMAVSLEARAPLLDRRVFQYAWSLPMRMKIRKGKNGKMQGKWLLRQILARHVPEALFERPKQGFTMPVGDWLRGPLKDWAEDLLDEQRLAAQGYVQPEPVRRAWEAHLTGQGRHAHKLWTILMFQSWLDKWEK